MFRADLQSLLRTREATINTQHARVQELSQTIQELRTRQQELKRHSDRTVRLIDCQKQAQGIMNSPVLGAQDAGVLMSRFDYPWRH